MTAVSPDAAVLLWDARHAADKIARFTAGHSFDDHLADDAHALDRFQSGRHARLDVLCLVQTGDDDRYERGGRLFGGG